MTLLVLVLAWLAAGLLVALVFGTLAAAGRGEP